MDLRDLLEVGPEIQCPVCQGVADAQGGPDVLLLSSFPFDLPCQSDVSGWLDVVPPCALRISGVAWIRIGSAVSHQRSGVSLRSWVWNLCGDMTVDSSIVVPCCHQRLRVICLARSFSSRGVDLLLLQSAECRVRQVFLFFLASSLFHGCLVDFDVPPSNSDQFSGVFLLVSLVPPMI